MSRSARTSREPFRSSAMCWRWLASVEDRDEDDPGAARWLVDRRAGPALRPAAGASPGGQGPFAPRGHGRRARTIPRAPAWAAGGCRELSAAPGLHDLYVDGTLPAHRLLSRRAGR